MAGQLSCLQHLVFLQGLGELAEQKSSTLRADPTSSTALLASSPLPSLIARAWTLRVRKNRPLCAFARIAAGFSADSPKQMPVCTGRAAKYYFHQ